MNVYFRNEIEDNLEIGILDLNQAEAVFKLIDTDRENIGRFLDFVPSTRTIEDEENYIKKKLHGVAEGTDGLFSIIKDDHIVGVIDLHFIDLKNKKAEIGYWLHSKAQRQGVMSKSVRKVCEYAFESIGLNKLSLFADVENTGSNAVAKRTGFSYVDTHKDYYFYRDQFRDMNEYCLIKRNF